MSAGKSTYSFSLIFAETFLTTETRSEYRLLFLKVHRFQPIFFVCRFHHLVCQTFAMRYLEHRQQAYGPTSLTFWWVVCEFV